MNAMYLLSAPTTKPADLADAANGLFGKGDWTTTLISAGVIIVAAVVLHIVLSAILGRMARRQSGRLKWGGLAAEALRKPVGVAVWLTAALLLLDLGMEVLLIFASDDAETVAFVNDVRVTVLPPARVLTIVFALTLFVATFVRSVQHEIEEALVRRGEGGDITAVQGLGSIAAVVVWLLGVLSALDGVGVDTTALLAVLGLSSAGLAFAAKDLLGNFFGGIMLLFNRPFETGDWVIVKGVEGAIERIGLYATQIRAGDKRLIWIPNQTFTANVVENPSRRTHRRFMETIGLRYEDLPKAAGIIDALLALLHDAEGIDQGQACRVSFGGYGDSTVNLTVLAYADDTGIDAFTELHKHLMLGIAEIVQAHQADFAFPTITLDGLPEGT